MTPENFAYLSCGVLSGALFILFLVVMPLRKQILQWKNRAFDQARAAQRWFVAFQSMVETALKVSVTEEGIDDGRSVCSIEDPTRFDGACLTLIHGAPDGDVVILDVKSKRRHIKVAIVPRLCIFSGINVNEAYWPDDSSGKTREDARDDLCAEHLNIWRN